MSRGTVFQALQKLSGDWSAPEYARFLTKDTLTELLSAFDMMEPLVRARLLLAAASLPAEAQVAMREQLQALSSKALGDKEEWVSTMGRVLSPLDGRAHINAVMKGQAAVRDALKALEDVTETARLDVMRPLEEVYLTPRLRRQHDGAPIEEPDNHFRLREGALERFMQTSRPAAANAQTAPASAPSAAPASAAAQDPSHPARPVASTPRPIPQPASRSAAAKSAGMNDMFRSSRQPTSSRLSTSAAAGKPGQRTTQMLDFSETVQRKQRVGMQHRRGPVSSSPMHVSFSPGHSQAPQSPAPHQVSAPNSSPAQAPKQAHPLQPARSPGSAPGLPASSGLSRTQMPLQAKERQTEQPPTSNGTATAVTRDSRVAEDMPNFDDDDIEDGEVPEVGELPEDMPSASKRGKYKQDSHHKPFREGSPQEQHQSSATTLPYPTR
ncbi:g486 [Coccomyxa viridis]|uniref:G486 protein n=1 Tax=Coccomyxa viridis TaxID=1274662 RepID=A0ABP1FL58_9CHLO